VRQDLLSQIKLKVQPNPRWSQPRYRVCTSAVIWSTKALTLAPHSAQSPSLDPTTLTKTSDAVLADDAQR